MAPIRKHRLSRASNPETGPRFWGFWDNFPSIPKFRSDKILQPTFKNTMHSPCHAMPQLPDCSKETQRNTLDLGEDLKDHLVPVKLFPIFHHINPLTDFKLPLFKTFSQLVAAQLAPLAPASPFVSHHGAGGCSSIHRGDPNGGDAPGADAKSTGNHWDRPWGEWHRCR